MTTISVKSTSASDPTAYSPEPAAHDTTAPSSSSRSSQQAVAGRLSGLSSLPKEPSGFKSLPPEILEQIAGHADPASVLALAQADRHTHESIAPEVQAALITGRDVPRATTHQAVDNVRKRIDALPQRLQNQPRAALGGQIAQIPHDQQFGIRFTFQNQIRAGAASAQQIIDQHGITDSGMISLLRATEQSAAEQRNGEIDGASNELRKIRELERAQSLWMG